MAVHSAQQPLTFLTFFIVNLVRLAVELFGQGTKLPLGNSVSGAVGNIATFLGAFAEWVRV